MIYGRRNVKRVVIVITDGDSQDKYATESAAKRAHNKGISVFAVGVGPKISIHELRTIASDNRFVVKSYSI